MTDAGKPQLTRADLARLDPTEVKQAMDDGQLNELFADRLKELFADRPGACPTCGRATTD